MANHLVVVTFASVFLGCADPGRSVQCVSGSEPCSGVDTLIQDSDAAASAPDSNVHDATAPADGNEDGIVLDTSVSPTCPGPVEGLRLQTGVISLTANLGVLPLWVHWYIDVAFNERTGEIAMLATNARLQDQEPKLGPNYNRPDGFEIDLGPEGWVASFQGCITWKSGLDFYFVTVPRDLRLVAFNGTEIHLTGLQLRGEISVSSTTDRDAIVGTLVTSGGTFGDPPAAVDGTNADWDGVSLLSEEIPSNLPRACDDEPCIELPIEDGACQVPTTYNPESECGG